MVSQPISSKMSYILLFTFFATYFCMIITNENSPCLAKKCLIVKQTTTKLSLKLFNSRICFIGLKNIYYRDVYYRYNHWRTIQLKAMRDTTFLLDLHDNKIIDDDFIDEVKL